MASPTSNTGFPRVSLWKEGQKLSTSHEAPIFLVADPEFLEVIGPNPDLEFIAKADAHEGGVYHPDTHEFYFSTSKQLHPKPNAQLMKLSLHTKEVSTVLPETPVANGMVLDRDGHLLICQQGVGCQPGHIMKLNLKTLETSLVADNWNGLQFNSPNDIVVKSDGSIWFTDPDYGWVQGFKDPPSIIPQVYRISPSGVVEAVADGFVKPNGLAFSHDEKHLYVTDTGSTVGDGRILKSNPHNITVFDIEDDGKTLTNRRLFASISTFDGSNEGIGVPDGVKVDKKGRVYVANPDGVQVFNPEGKLLGLIRVAGASNVGFVGKKRDKLLILNGESIQGVRLNADGAGLHYVEAVAYV